MACTSDIAPLGAVESNSETIVVTDVDRAAGNNAVNLEGYSIKDNSIYCFRCAEESANEILKGSVIVINYSNGGYSDVIPVQSYSVLSTEVFNGKIVYLKKYGACLITSIEDEYQFHIVKGLSRFYFDNISSGTEVAVYGDLSGNTAIKASHLEVLNDTSPELNNSERLLVEKYGYVKSYAECLYETPIGDRYEEYADILSVTDAKIKQEYGISDLENYSAVVNKFTDSTTVEYTLYFGGYSSFERYYVTVYNSGDIECNASNAGNYSRFLPYFDVEKLKTAEDKLKKEANIYDYDSNSGFYLTINEKGQLCLSFESIVKITPETTFGGGQIVDGGCNIDHRHVFVSEVICEEIQ